MVFELIGDMVRNAGLASLPTLKRAAGVVTPYLPIPQPVMLVGAGSAARLAHAIGGFGHRRLLLVTDAVIARLGLTAPIEDALAAAGCAFTRFDEITPDAPVALVERGIERFAAEECDAVLAVGGGSVIDAAKVIALAAANRKPPRALAGYFRARRGPAPIYAVPTTAGTGSEVTVAAVISDPAAERKFFVADTRIVPDMAALDPTLMVGLPPAVTAATGMDALTHAVEAYISGWATPATDRWALAATALIWQYLPRAWRDGSDLAARENMALASMYAGLAFTRANVGNVHAIAHQLGGKYHTPHGLANAIMLPSVLRFSRYESAARLATLARRVGLDGRGDLVLAEAFIEAVQSLNDSLGIPRKLDALREDDIVALAKAACWEADTNYPVPRRMSEDDAQALLRGVLGAETVRESVPAKRKPRAVKAVKAVKVVKAVKGDAARPPREPHAPQTSPKAGARPKLRRVA